MGGKFKLDKAHKEVPDHLDHVQHFGFGALKERYDKNGELIDTRFQPSKKFAKKERIENRNFNIAPVTYKIPTS